MSDKDQSKRALVKMNDAWERFRKLVHNDLPLTAATMDAFTRLANRKRTYR